MQPRTWGTSQDGLLEYISLTSATLDESINIMLGSFFIHENVSIGVKLPQYKESVIELKGLVLKAAKDGAAIVAIEKSTGKVAGVVFNTLRVKSDVQPTYYEQYRDNAKHPPIKALANFLVAADNAVDLYELCNAECALEISFVATLPEFRGRGIAKKFFELAIKLGEALHNGQNVRVPVNEEPLRNTPPPTIMSVLCTSHITQHLAKLFGFKIATKMDFKQYVFEGETFANRIGPSTPFATIEYLELKK